MMGDATQECQQKQEGAPILRRTIWGIIMEQGKLYPLWAMLLNGGWSSQHFCPFECRTRLTYFLHPKLRRINAVLIPLKLIPLTLRRLWHACGAQEAFPKATPAEDWRQLRPSDSLRLPNCPPDQRNSEPIVAALNRFTDLFHPRPHRSRTPCHGAGPLPMRPCPTP